MAINIQKEFRRKYEGLTWNSKYIGEINTPRYTYLTTHKIEQTANAIESGKFSNQNFLPYESFFWWFLWINNRTELDRFGNFREKQMDAQLEITIDDAGKIWLDPTSWFKKKKKRIPNGMGKGGVIIYNKVANETQVIIDEKARINWAMVMSHGWMDANCCFYCHTTLFQSHKTRDHVLPKSRCNGFEANIVCSCKKCNGKKASMTPSEWREQLSGYVKGRIPEETRYYYHEILDTLDNILE